MKVGKFVSMGAAILTAVVFWVVPVWAEEDTGYPWFGDIVEENNQPISHPNTTFQLAPVIPGDEDTGYPWFADIKEDEMIGKRVRVFGLQPQTEEGDTGYPWHADTNGDNENLSNQSKTTQ